MTEQPRWEDRARSFGATAETYDAHRPSYPPEAVAWLLPPGARRVLDLGAGTGKLTEGLLAAGVEVVAVDPDPLMLAVLRARHPAAQALEGSAEAVPVADASVDAVVAGQAWHWFDHPRALAEVRRVLEPGGTGWLGLAWNGYDPTEPWERELADRDPDWVGASADYWPPGLPHERTEETIVRWIDQVTPQRLRAEQATHSSVALAPAAEREQRLALVEGLVRRQAAHLDADEGTAEVPFHRATYCFRHRV